MSVAESFNPTGINLSARAVDKVRELVAEEENAALKLRVYITGGGCSGSSTASASKRMPPRTTPRLSATG